MNALAGPPQEHEHQSALHRHGQRERQTHAGQSEPGEAVRRHQLHGRAQQGHFQQHGRPDERPEPGTGAAPRRALSLTALGREDLLERLRHPKQAEITDQVRFNTVLAFLRHLPDRHEQAAVLRRRLEFLETPTSFFYDAGAPVSAEQTGDLFRQGMLRVARATGRAEREWLTEAVEQLERSS